MSEHPKEKLAIIGSGISGLVCAYHLNEHYDLEVFEANDYIGGHTRTVEVHHNGDRQNVDTGFIVFNDWTYPSFIQLIDEIGVEWQETSMSFSVKCEKTGLEYNGTSLSGIFSQSKNVFSPGFWKMLREIVIFGEKARELIEARDPISVENFLVREGFSQRFIEHYFIPMGASIWSCPPKTFKDFPMRFIAEFYENHGMLNINDRPVWRVIKGGSSSYIEPLIQSFKEKIHCSSPVKKVTRINGQVVLEFEEESKTFDKVIFASHADQSLAMLSDASEAEREALSQFPYQENKVTLHTDESLMPKEYLAWASWNYRIPKEGDYVSTLTYNMTMLQGLNTHQSYLVSLNSDDDIDPDKILQKFTYSHPLFKPELYDARDWLSDHAFESGVGFVGAWLGNGFHEDGVQSALRLCSKLGVGPFA